MSFFKRFLIFIAAASLSLWLFSAASSYALIATVGSPTYIKSWLSGGDFYKKIVPESLKLATAQPSPDGNQNQAQVQQLTPLIQEVLTPQLLQSLAESAIDGAGHWVQGKTPKPDFVIQIAPLRETIIDKAANYMYTKVSALPTCTGYPSSFDPLTATCRPPGNYTAQDFRANAADFASNLPFMKYDVLTYETVTTNTNPYWDGELPKTAPTIYSWLVKTPYIFGFLALISALVIILLRKDHIRAWRTVGHTLLIAGLFLLFSAVVTRLLLNHPIGTFGGASAAQASFAEAIAIPLVRSFSLTLSNISLYFGVGFIALSSVCYIVARFLRRKQHLLKNEELLSENVAKQEQEAIEKAKTA